MARRTAGPPAAIQQEPPAATAPVGPAETPKPAETSLGWRVALFIWATAFVFLIVYELLNTLVRTLSGLF